MTSFIDSIGAEASQLAAAVLQEKQAYRQHVLDLSLPAIEPKYLISVGGVPTVPAGELVGIKGRAKVGKSQLEYYLIAAMLAGASRGSVRPLQARYKVLLFDTEQSQVSLKKCCERALKCAGLASDKNPANFLPFYLRPLTVEERRQVISAAVEEEQPDIVFIDGIRDLLRDFNSLIESSELIQWLLSLTAQHGCTVVSVLHQNKSKEDGSMRGHLGTELLNKLTDCFEVIKQDGKFVVSCTDSRNLQCPDFSFSINAEGCFQAENTLKEDKGAARAAEIQHTLKLCFKEKQALRFQELVNAYQLEGAVSGSTAKRHIRTAKEHDVLQVHGDMYTFPCPGVSL